MAQSQGSISLCPWCCVTRNSSLRSGATRKSRPTTPNGFSAGCAVEAAVSKSETLCGGRFTVADISVGYALLLAERIGLAKDFTPAVTAFWQRLRKRDGFCRAVKAEILAGEQQKVAATSW